MANGITYKTVLTEKALKFFTHEECNDLRVFLTGKKLTQIAVILHKNFETVRTKFKSIIEKVNAEGKDFIIMRCHEQQLMKLEIVTDEAEDEKALLAFKKPFWEEKKKVSLNEK